MTTPSIPISYPTAVHHASHQDQEQQQRQARSASSGAASTIEKHAQLVAATDFWPSEPASPQSTTDIEGQQSRTSIELQALDNATGSTENITHAEGSTTEHDPHAQAEGAFESSLPPVDRGRGAWGVLAACFVLEALVWGFPFAFGVFNEKYESMPEFQGNLSAIAAIGTTATGIMYLSGAFIYQILKRRPDLRRPFTYAGFVIMLASLVGASFANTTTQLLATQGVGYGIGGSIHYFPALLYMDEWFAARKGLAYGVVWAGGGMSGFALPLILSHLLEQYGFRTTLRIWVVASIAITTPVIYFMKPRIPVRRGNNNSSTGGAPRNAELRFVREPAFWILSAGNMIQGAGYFLPTLYMPLFAREAGLPGNSGTIAVSITNGCTMFGSIFAGMLVDRYHVTTAINVCAVGTVVAVLLFWSFAVYVPVLYVFAVLYGTFAGGFAATWTGVTEVLRKKWPATDTGMIIAIFAAGKGLGVITSGPLSGALVDADSWKGSAEYAWGSGYGLLILFSGVTAAATGMGWCGKKAGFV